MFLYEAEGEIATPAVRAGKPTCSAPNRRTSAFVYQTIAPANWVTFLETLVSDYQILLPVRTFTCTLVQQSSQYKSMTFSGRLLCNLALLKLIDRVGRSFFDFFSWCCKSDA